MYKSTRSEMNIAASKAIIDGIASDGGLFVTDNIYSFTSSELENQINMSYEKLAFEIISKYLLDFNLDSLKLIINKAYKDTFDIKEIVQLKKCKDVYFLELYHGRTLAFKDVALSILPYLLEESKKIQNINNNQSIILTATSGDTGSAALSGFANLPNTKMIVLYPTDGISTIQEKQMLSFASENRKVIAIKGNFDDAQSLVKKAFNDERLKKYNLSSANSINIGRLIPQIVYYFYSYYELVRTKEINFLDKINFSVPTGNFGNILAGFLAKKMGLPINELICASNSNNVLTEFFKDKKYNKEREFIKTSSPSMDILVSSNLERLLYYKYNTEKVNKLMKDLEEKGHYEIDQTIEGFYGESVTESETLQGINEVYKNNKYLIDTHTSVAYIAYNKYRNDTKDSTKTIVLSTAHPFKFPKSIDLSINKSNVNNNDFEIINKLSKETNTKIPDVINTINREYKKEVWEEKAYEKLTNLIKEI